MMMTNITDNQELPKSYVEQFLEECKHPEGFYLQSPAEEIMRSKDKKWFLGFCSQLELLVLQSEIVREYVNNLKEKESGN